MPKKLRDEAVAFRQLWSGYWSSRVVMTANNLRVFDALTEPKESAAIGEELGISPRGTEILLDALTGLGLLKKHSGKYHNSGMAGHFLVSGSPWYQGDILRHADALWKNWSELDSIVINGKPVQSARDHGAFIRGMHNIAVLKAERVIDLIHLKGMKKALDLGGGPGTYAMEMARRGVTAVLFDVPDTLEIARSLVKEMEVEGVEFMAGDFMVDDIGSEYDLILISQVLHSYAPSENLTIMKKAHNALNPGGKVVVQDFLIDASRTTPAQAALFSVNMLVNTDNGRCYTFNEIRDWLKQAGFHGMKAESLDDSVLISGVKDVTETAKGGTHG